MPFHIFFSWQSDRPNAVGRTMIETALQQAIDELYADAEVDLAVRELAIDKDTAGVPGSPAITDTIFEKIERATVFLSDLTYVSLRENGDGIPNPNVLIEHGWALKALTPRRVISVMNTTFGHPDKHPLPFDLRHVRRPILFGCASDAEPDTRRKAKAELSKSLAVALKAIISDREVRALLQPPGAAEPDSREQGAAAALQELRNNVRIGNVPEIVSTPRLTLILAPFASTEHPMLEPKRVTEQQKHHFPPSFSEKVEHYSDGDQWWTCSIPRHRPQPHLNLETSWLMRLVRPGNLIYQKTIVRRIDDDPVTYVDGCKLEAHIVRNLERMASIAAALNLGGAALVSISLDGIQDVALKLAAPCGPGFRKPEIVLPPVKLNDLSAPIAEALHDSFDRLWLDSGRPDGSPSFATGKWQGYENSPIYWTD